MDWYLIETRLIVFFDEPITSHVTLSQGHALFVFLSGFFCRVFNSTSSFPDFLQKNELHSLYVGLCKWPSNSF